MKQLITILGLLALPTLAQEIAAPDADWEQLRVQAAELRGQAKLQRTRADQMRAEAEKLCRGKLFVSGCMVDARKSRNEAEQAIRQGETEAVEIEQRVRAHDYEVKLRQRAEKEQKREMKAAERAEEIRGKDEKRRLKNEKRVAKEERRRQTAQQE